MDKFTAKQKKIESLGITNAINLGDSLLTLALAIVLSVAIINSVWLSVVIVVAFPLLLLIKKRGEFGILLIVVLLSSIVFENAIPYIDIGIGNIYLQDFIFFYLLVISFFKYKGRVGLDNNKKDYISIYLILFFIICIASLINAIVFNGVDFNSSTGLFRYLSYYLLYFVVTTQIRNKKQVVFLVNGMAIVGTVVGMAMLIQSGLGDSVHIMPGRVVSVQTFGETSQATRILPPGQTLVFALFLLSSSLISVVRKKKYIYIYFVNTVCGIGVLLTFNRSYWVVCFIAFIVLLLTKKGKEKVNYVVKFVFPVSIMLLFFVLVALYNPSGFAGHYLNSIEVRFTSLFMGDDLYQSGSIEYRKEENKYAIASIIKNPIFGIGLSGKYREVEDYRDEYMETYCHNGYLWALVMIGIVGFIAIVSFYLAFLFRSIRNYGKIKDDYHRALLLGIILFVVGVMIINIVNPMFMQNFSIVVISVLMGLAEALDRIRVGEVGREVVG